MKYQNRIAQCAQQLVDNQCANGQWGYGDPSIFVMDLNLPPLPPKFKGQRKVPVKRKRDGPAAGDNSNSQYALLGLRACHDAGIVLPASTCMELAAKWWRESQTRRLEREGAGAGAQGWCYGKHEHKPYGSMTVGGIASLVICDYIQGKDAKKDREVANGMEWLAKNFSVAYNPGPTSTRASRRTRSTSTCTTCTASSVGRHPLRHRADREPVLVRQGHAGPHRPAAPRRLLEERWRQRAARHLLRDPLLRKATRALIDVPTPGAGSLPKK